MRFIFALLILLFALFGILFGALNYDSIDLDFYFFAFHFPKGAAILIALLSGWIIGGAVLYFGVVLRLQSRLRRAIVQHQKLQHTIESASQQKA